MNPLAGRVAGFTPAQWRVLTVALLAASAPLVVDSSSDYMMNGIQNSFGVSNAGRLKLTLAPRIASLIGVFVAGILTDALPWRRTLVAAAGVFLLGAATVSAAGGLPLLLLGQSLAGIGGIVLGVSGLAIIGDRFKGPERAWAFSLWAVAAPAVYLVFPIAASWIALLWNWRAVTLLWALVGMALVASAVRLTGGGAGTGGLRVRLVTPLLAGVVLASGVTAVNTAGDGALLWAPCTAVAMAALLALGVLRLRARDRVPPLDLRVLRGQGSVMLVAAILLVQTASTLWYFTRVIFNRTYQLDDTSMALVIVPVQLSGVLGGWLGGWTMRRLGAPLAAILMLVPAGSAALFPVFMDRATSLSVVVASMAVWHLLAVSAAVPVTAAFMRLAPEGGTGAASSTRIAVSAVGVTVGGVVVSSLVFAALGTSVSSSLQTRGVPQARADAVGSALQNGLRVSDIPDVAGLSLTQMREVLHSQGPVMLEGKDRAYDTAGIVAMSVNLLAALMMFGFWRRTIRAGPLGAPSSNLKP